MKIDPWLKTANAYIVITVAYLLLLEQKKQPQTQAHGHNTLWRGSCETWRTCGLMMNSWPPSCWWLWLKTPATCSVPLAFRSLPLVWESHRRYITLRHTAIRNHPRRQAHPLYLLSTCPRWEGCPKLRVLSPPWRWEVWQSHSAGTYSGPGLSCCFFPVEFLSHFFFSHKRAECLVIFQQQ